MPTLIEQQRQFRAWMLATEPSAEGEILGRRMGAAARLAIYRNTIIGNLTGALRLTFPAIERLVGAPFFAQAAAQLIPTSPPQSADLYEFGEHFPDFLSHYEPAHTLPYLASVARLEWSVGRALHAPDAPYLIAADLAACTDPLVRFLPHPSLSLLRLDHPVAAIRSAVLAHDPEERERLLAAIDLRPTPETLAVHRSPIGLQVTPLSSSAFALARALACGENLTTALQETPPDEAPVLLADFVSRGFFKSLAPHIPDEGANP